MQAILLNLNCQGDDGSIDIGAIASQINQLNQMEVNMREREASRWDEELVGLLQYLFITTRKYDINSVAKAMGMEYHDLYAYVSGKRTMPAPVLRRLTEVTHDLAFMDCVFVNGPIHYFWADEKHGHSGDIVKETLDLGEAEGAIFGQLRAALEDGKITSQESTAIFRAVTVSEQRHRDLMETLQNTMKLRTVSSEEVHPRKGDK